MFVHEPPHCSGNTLVLILSHGIDVFALTVCLVTSVMSDHFLIKSEATLVCSCDVDANVLRNHPLIQHLWITIGQSLTFHIFQVLEICVSATFCPLFEPFQSAFRAYHSTETILTKVVKDLDLSVGFDTVENCILLYSCLKNTVCFL